MKILYLIIPGFVLLACLAIFLAIPGGGISVNTAHKNIVGFPIPDGAEDVKYDCPSIYNEWRNDYCIISYRLAPSELSKVRLTPPSGFSKWEHLTEIFLGHQLFTYAQMPHAWISSQKRGKNFVAMIVDPDKNAVYVLSSYD